LRKNKEVDHPEVHLSFAIPSCDSAIARAVKEIRRVMQLLAVEEEWVFRSELSLHEALLNSYLHGNRADPAKKIRISCCLSPAKVQIEVEDEGQGYEPSAAEVSLEQPLKRSGGRGLFLIRELMHSVTVSQRGNHIRMRLMKE
jgi:serine/threonine-protein kinase RsbW